MLIIGGDTGKKNDIPDIKYKGGWRKAKRTGGKKKILAFHV